VNPLFPERELETFFSGGSELHELINLPKRIIFFQASLHLRNFVTLYKANCGTHRKMVFSS
jgi:hypothetical protein